MNLFTNKTVVITGGTGSLGKIMLHRLLSRKFDFPKKIIIFSRDEAKQHQLKVEYQQKKKAQEYAYVYHNFERLTEFRIGDIRDYPSVASLLTDVDIVINTAALKQVPSCEYFPYEAVKTNILGAQNIVRAIQERGLKLETVVGVSTDKACKPVNVMGMTKALQERIFLTANMANPQTRFICVRYGNVLASRGSVIPLFQEQIQNGGPLTITTPEMTRFLLSLDQAVDTILAALAEAHPGEIYIPKIRSARITDIAETLINNRDLKIKFTGIRPGEKLHEVLISEEEVWRTVDRGDFYAIQSLLSEAGRPNTDEPQIVSEFTSANDLLTRAELQKLLRDNQMLKLN